MQHITGDAYMALPSQADMTPHCMITWHHYAWFPAIESTTWVTTMEIQRVRLGTLGSEIAYSTCWLH